MKLSMIEVFQLQAEGKIKHGAKLFIKTEFAEYDYIYNKKKRCFLIDLKEIYVRVSLQLIKNF